MTENIYAAAYVKSLEKNMFTDRDFDQMLSFLEEDIVRALSDHGYMGKDAEDMLKNEEKKTREICMHLCKNERLLDVMLARDTFHNIKVALKCGICAIAGKSLFKTPSRVDAEAVLLGAKTGDFRKIQDEFSELAELAYKRYKKSKNPGEIDLCLDELMVEYILEKSTVSEFVRGWAQMYGEFAGIKKQYLTNVASKEEKPPAMLFKEFDDALTEYLRNAHFSFFNEDTVFAYFFGKEIEIKNLRLILSGNKSAVERLRKAYV